MNESLQCFIIVACLSNMASYRHKIRKDMFFVCVCVFFNLIKSLVILKKFHTNEEKALYILHYVTFYIPLRQYSLLTQVNSECNKFHNALAI